MQGFPKSRGSLSGGAHKKDHNMSGSTLGSPNVGTTTSLTSFGRLRRLENVKSERFRVPRATWNDIL